jgi:cyanate permease
MCEYSLLEVLIEKGFQSHFAGRVFSQLQLCYPVDAITTPGLATARVNCSVFALTVLGPKEAEMRIIVAVKA